MRGCSIPLVARSLTGTVTHKWFNLHAGIKTSRPAGGNATSSWLHHIHLDRSYVRRQTRMFKMMRSRRAANAVSAFCIIIIIILQRSIRETGSACLNACMHACLHAASYPPLLLLKGFHFRHPGQRRTSASYPVTSECRKQQWLA
ncbi:hypothetical protein XENOCAPTIV_008336 [Xenoophorus captivus]|uniref:Uncharacterized protein n=1 Tax=Xenoophorus captivus TaxID=1517983 RepID=A0ABV0RPG7_9TELE